MTTSANGEIRSAGVTAAAAFSVLGSLIALLAWGWFFRNMLSLPADSTGKHIYEAQPIGFFSIALVPPFLIALSFFTGIGLFRLQPWARKSALLWATVAMSFSSLIIAFRPYETFVIEERWVSELASFKQLIVIGLLIFLLPMSIWWLFYFTRKHVIQQFERHPLPSAESSSGD